MSSIDTRELMISSTEAALQRCFYKKAFWKYATNLQENTHAITYQPLIYILSI